jgi:hypothetical protein
MREKYTREDGRNFKTVVGTRIECVESYLQSPYPGRGLGVGIAYKCEKN